VAEAQIESYPNRPIRYVVPFPPGGPTDVISRPLTEAMRNALGQAVVIENIGGAAAAIGVTRIARSPPDGYTIGLGNTGAMTINPSLYPDLQYNPLRDFTPISLITEYDNVLVVPASLSVRTLDDVIQLARSKSEGLDYGSAGTGSSNHLSMELMARAFGLKLNHVPYRGTSQALLDLAAGRISLLFDLVSTAAPLIASGQLRAIATTGRQRHPLLPDVPAFAETKPDFTVVGWMAVFGPAGLPDAVRDRLNASIVQALAQPAMIERLRGLGYAQRSSTPSELAARVAQDSAMWGSLIRNANIKPE
jgi:tripartite-type tricarboxylate transporter receptor subunit TctC